MFLEDLTVYTGVDPNNRFVQTSARNTVTGLDRNETAHLYRDFTAGFFSSDFTHLYEAQINSIGQKGLLGIWGITNTPNDIKSIVDAGGDAFYVYFNRNPSNVYFLTLGEIDGGAVYEDSYSNFSLSTPYYLKVVRDESIGTYGTLYCYIYSDSGRTILVDTLAIMLHSSKKDFRYLHAAQSYNDGQTPFTITGWSQNYDLGLVVNNPWYYYAQQ